MLVTEIRKPIAKAGQSILCTGLTLDIEIRKPNQRLANLYFVCIGLTLATNVTWGFLECKRTNFNWG